MLRRVRTIPCTLEENLERCGELDNLGTQRPGERPHVTGRLRPDHPHDTIGLAGVGNTAAPFIRDDAEQIRIHEVMPRREAEIDDDLIPVDDDIAR